jgi:hypothetical protein
MEVINCVFYQLYQVFYGIGICNISINDAVYDILQRNMLSSEEKLAYNLLCFIDQTADNCLNSNRNIYSLRLGFRQFNHNHDT